MYGFFFLLQVPFNRRGVLSLCQYQASCFSTNTLLSIRPLLQYQYQAFVGVFFLVGAGCSRSRSGRCSRAS